MLVPLLISDGLAVVKIFLYEINYTFIPGSFPLLFSINKFKWQEDKIYLVMVIFNAIYDLVNYILFVMVNIVFDVILVVKFRQTIKEKFQQSNEMLKENRESVRRVIAMVILSGTLNVILK